jgi:hypothetical protein
MKVWVQFYGSHLNEKSIEILLRIPRCTVIRPQQLVLNTLRRFLVQWSGTAKFFNTGTRLPHAKDTLKQQDITRGTILL